MNQSSDDRPRIYLDNAATSWPKPPGVYDAVDHYQRNIGAPASRGAYAEAVEVSALVESARRSVARLLGLTDAAHLVFTSNGTDSLNMVIHGLLRPGDHVVTSVIEHNSVLRPLAHLEAAGQITVSLVGCDAAGVVDPDDVRKALRRETKLVAVAHASNVTGAIQPIADISRVAHHGGALMLCDAAQTVGHVRVDMDELGLDFLAASGHKGMLGPLGTGVLAIQRSAASVLKTTRQGGTGTQSDQTRQPDELPFKFESGNLNVPGIVGLGAGVDFIEQRGLERIHREGLQLTARLLESLHGIKGVRVMGPRCAEQRVPLVSIVLAGYDPQEVAASLDAAYRIQVRAGLHCAPAMHRALETDQAGGTVRFSLGAFNTQAEIEAAGVATREIASAELWT